MLSYLILRSLTIGFVAYEIKRAIFMPTIDPYNSAYIIPIAMGIPFNFELIFGYKS